MSTTNQVAMDGLEPDEDLDQEAEADYLWRAQLWSAMRSFVLGYVSAKGGRGYDGVAAALDKRWSPHGRGVSPSFLRASLNDSERGYFRAEWLGWFAARSQDVAELLARRAKPAKTEAEMRADLEAELREELSHKRAEAVIRRARLR